MNGSQHPDAVIDELAAAQQGIVSRAQLIRAGVSKRVIDGRVGSGRLKVRHRGVYQAGPVAGPRAREMAAALACGPAAVVSHRSAGGSWACLAPRPPQDPVEVMVAGLVRRRVSGIQAHRTRRLGTDEVVRLDGVPITSPARTLLDLAGTVGPAELERAVAHAERLNLVGVTGMIAMLDAHPRHHGGRVLRMLLESTAPPALTRSEPESRLLDLIRKARLPTPQANARLNGFEVDFLWAAEKLVVEVDGYAWHSSARAFACDRRRDATLTAAGFRVVRFTWADIVRTRKRRWSRWPACSAGDASRAMTPATHAGVPAMMSRTVARHAAGLRPPACTGGGGISNRSAK